MIKNRIVGSRAPKAKYLHTHCSWCGKPLPNSRSYRMEFCNSTCCNKRRFYVIKVLTPPDSWKLCQLGDCDIWFPIWGALGKVHMAKTCCCQKHGNIHSARKRSAAIKNRTYSNKHTKKITINRSEHCFKKEDYGTGSIRCRRYNHCKFVDCSGFEK